MKNVELKADNYIAFESKLDFSVDSKLGKSGKMALKLTVKGMLAAKNNVQIDMNDVTIFVTGIKFEVLSKNLLS